MPESKEAPIYPRRLSVKAMEQFMDFMIERSPKSSIWQAKVFMAIVRHQGESPASISEHLTGDRDNRSVQNAMSNLVSLGLIERCDVKYVYGGNPRRKIYLTAKGAEIVLLTKTKDV